MSSNIADLLSKYQLDDKTMGGVELSETGKDLSEMVSNYRRQLTAVSGAYESDSDSDSKSAPEEDESKAESKPKSTCKCKNEDAAKAILSDVSSKYSASVIESTKEPEASKEPEPKTEEEVAPSIDISPIYSKLIEKIHKYNTTGKKDKLTQLKEKLEPKMNESEQIKKVVELINGMLKTSGGGHQYKKVLSYRDTLLAYNKFLKDGENITAIKALLKKILHALSIQRVDNEPQFMNLASTIQLYVEAKSDEKKGGKQPKGKAKGGFKLNDFLQ